MSGSADRLPRLLALVPYLQQHPGSRIGELAELFGVTPAQVRKDLNLLWMCGLPGHTPGDLIDIAIESDDSVTLTNAEELARPLRLTAEEGLALVVALRTIADVPGLTDRGALDRVLAKVEAAAGAAAAEPADQVVVTVEAEAAVVETVRTALAEQRRVHLRYYVPARDETTERDVDPMRLLVVDGQTYLEGWCRRVEGVRTFRLDRVAEVQLLDAPASPPAEAQSKDISGGLYQPSPDDQLVTLELGPRGRWVADYYPCESVEELPDGGLRVGLRTADTRWVRRLALRLGATGRVVSPPDLAESVRADAAAALSAYEG